MYGRTDITFQAAPGAGIVSSIVFMSCDRDEVNCLNHQLEKFRINFIKQIDWELVGNYDYQIQTNFFSQGNETTYGRGRNHTVENPINVAHTYSVEWTRHKIDWLIDDVVVRTEKASDSKDGYGFPQTPSQVKFGIWVGGNANANPDAMNWAGGKADFKNAPFNAYLKHVKVVDYAGGDGPSPNKVDSYSYGDRSGSFESIKYLPAGSGNVGGGKPNKAAAAAISASSASASSSSAQPTATGDKTSTMVKPSTSSGASESASSTDAASTTQTTTASVAQTTTKSAGSRIGAGVGAVVLAALAALL